MLVTVWQVVLHDYLIIRQFNDYLGYGLYDCNLMEPMFAIPCKIDHLGAVD